MREVRVRFAPSPTGALHIGGVRTALFNYLFAKKNGGKFLIRIEDTDQGRFVPGAEKYIMEALSWCGIQADESPEVGGPHSPYRQSERKIIYQKYARQLIDSGHAYYAFDTPEDLEDLRTRLKDNGSSHLNYNAVSRLSMKNSLTLDQKLVEEKINNGESYVIRLKTPEDQTIVLHDLIRGKVEVNSATLDDKVLMKSDGLPTYHLANVVDDYLMAISHVIRGEEWLPSAPTHVLLYKSFGWENEMPEFAHLPLILKPDGNGKLSKRDADKAGFPIFPLSWPDPVTGEISRGFKEFGYIAEALLNFLALLGWNDGTSQEVFTLDELVNRFTIERIGKSGTKFDIEKAKWFNQNYLHKSSIEKLSLNFQKYLAEKSITVSDHKAQQIIKLLLPRAHFEYEIWQQAETIINSPREFDIDFVDKKWDSSARNAINQCLEFFENAEFNSADVIKASIQASIEGINRYMQVLRFCLTGASSGPDLFPLILILGKQEVTYRLNTALKILPNF